VGGKRLTIREYLPLKGGEGLIGSGDHNLIKRPLLGASAIIADIPKGNGAIRPVALLSLEDRTVYADLIGSLLPQISAGLRWSQGSVDFSYQLAAQPDRVNWFSNRFVGWKQFRHKQLEKIQDGEKITHVVVTDLTGF
jgi:hypothetical protein